MKCRRYVTFKYSTKYVGLADDVQNIDCLCECVCVCVTHRRQLVSFTSVI